MKYPGERSQNQLAQCWGLVNRRDSDVSYVKYCKPKLSDSDPSPPNPLPPGEGKTFVMTTSSLPLDGGGLKVGVINLMGEYPSLITFH
jgi:hypothetical protein